MILIGARLGWMCRPELIFKPIVGLSIVPKILKRLKR